MKVAIVQISDIHIQNARDFVISRLDYAIRSARPIINECQKVIVAITGDIANMGKQEEYQVAYDYFSKFSEGIIAENDDIKSVEYVIVPGNHDCFFSEDQKQLRLALIESCLKNDSSLDIAISDNLLQAQTNFWKFYSQLTKQEDTPFISHEIVHKCNDGTELIFHCYNTSLLSNIQEQVGSLMVPCDKFLPLLNESRSSIVISLFHHNTGWLNPSHNKKAFEKHLLETSDIVLCGHEHVRQDLIKSDIGSGDKILYFESSAFQDNRQSEFAINVIDTESGKLQRHILKYADAERPTDRIYKDLPLQEEDMKRRIKGIVVNSQFEQTLLKLPIPIIHPVKGNLALNDCYEFPDLEPQVGRDTDIAVYLDSIDIVEDSGLDYKVLGIEGASRSGKTSLLKMLYLRFYQSGIFPLLLSGNEVADIRKLPDLYKKKYKEQYNENNKSFDFYSQLNREKRVVLIDNIERSKLNEEGLQNLYDKLLVFFDKILFTVGDRINVANIMATTSIDDNYRQYRLLSLGCVKRNRLIEKWLRLGMKPETINQQVLEEEVKSVYNTVSMLLGEQFISPYPFFLMSLLQSLNEAAKSVETQQTFYAYCYKSLLISSLMSIKLDSNRQRELLNFLAVTAFGLFKKHKKTNHISHDEFSEIFNEYKSKFIFSYNSLEECLEKLTSSNIMECVDEYYVFSSKYIYYYLAAEELAKIIKKPEGGDIVNKLCENIYDEESANILIFLVYHTRDANLLEMLILTGMYPFDKYPTVTLSTNDPILVDVMSLIPQIREKVLLQDVDPRKQRDKELAKQDTIERRQEQTHRVNSSKSTDILKGIEQDPNLKDLLTAMHSIRILGQIVKNERSGIERQQIIDLITQTYLTSFRMIGFFGSDIQQSQKEIVDHLVEEAKSKGKQIDTIKVREDVGKLLSFLIYKSCLMIFNNLIHAVGTKDFDEIYKTVAKDLDTPAAHLVSFSIRSYYGKLNITDLEELYEQFDGNILAQQILRARAIHYVYHHTLSPSDKQRIGSICGLQLANKYDVNKGKR